MQVRTFATILFSLGAASAATAQDVAQNPAEKVVVARVDERGRAVIEAEPISLNEPLPSRFGAPLPQGPKVIGAGPAVRTDKASSSADCAPVQPLDSEAAIGLVVTIATEEKFYPELVVAVARKESQFDSTATSPKGAYGLLQLTEDTASDLGVDRCIPEQNVRGGISYLRQLLEQYGNPVLMLAAYNAGPAAVDQAGGVPAYPETLNYIAEIMTEYPGWRLDAPAAGEMKPVNAPVAARPGKPPAKATGQAGAKPASDGWKSGFVISFDGRN